MPTTVAKLKGTLSLGSTPKQVEAQVSNIGTPQTVTRDSAVTVLTGDVVQAAATYSWSLTGTMLLDLSDPAGVYYWVNQRQGQQVPFSFLPAGAAGPTITGTVILDGWNTEELAAGALITSKFAWPCQGQINVAPPIAATGATAGTPGTFTPAGAAPPANLAAMTGLTASPATAWTTGQYVVLADASWAHWSATAWVAGKA